MYSDLKRIGELSSDGIFLFNTKDGKFDYINNAFAAIFKTDTKSLLDKPEIILPYLRTEDMHYLQNCAEDLKKNNAVINAEFRLELKPDDIIHVRCDAYSIYNTDVLAGIVKNITKEKEHEDYIINYGAKKDTLLDMMTHNLSGPLLLSKNILTWMQKTYKEKTPGEISAQLHIIQESTQQCLDIVNDFLKEEHLESERIYVKKTRFDVLERIVATLEKLIATNRNKKFRIITDLDNVNINTDSVKFFQIIHNLVSNAIKFTPEGGQIDIIIEEKEDTFVFSVKDNGIGIPAAFHSTLFEKRSPARREGLNNELSTGLGLYIVKSLTELIGGKVSFHTEEDKGTVFSVELPKE